MLFKNLVTKILLLSGFCFLCVSCASMPESGSDDNSAAQGFQNEPVDQAISQERLGMAYLLGRGVPENKEQAVYWFQKAAEQGSSTAANELGYLYASGTGVAQNYELALGWYQQAADAGIPSAKYNLGLLYAYGLGTAVDKAKADYYFQEAARLGFTPAEQSSTG